MLEEIHKISSEECEDVFNVLNVIFINIKLGLLIDRFEIVNQIENCMNKLDVIQKQNVLKELKQTYQDDLFKKYFQSIELIIMNNLKQKINENYEEQYEQYKQQKDQRKLLQLFQQEQFWQYIPQNIKIIQPILMKIEKERFFEILEFIDYSQNKIKKSQISILKSLFNIKYIQQNLLNNKEQRLLEQFIGSLLFKQLHEFENYIEYYQNKDIISQIQYKQVQNRQNIQELQIFPTLFQLLTQDFKEQQYLDIYLQEKLSCINFNENPQQLLEDYIRTDNDIDEVYFKIVIYFWGIYCSQLINLGDSIRKQLPIKDNIKNKAIQAIQQSDFIQSEIQLYFFDRFIYFNENFQFQNKFNYDQQRSKKIQILKQIQLLLDNYNQIGQLSQIQSQFIKLWEDIQELGFFQINLIIYQNEKIKNLIKFLWITNIQQNHTDIIQMIFQNNQLKNDLNSLFRILINSKIKDNRILIQDLICLNLILQINQKSQQNLTIDYYKIYKITPILLNHYYQNIQYPSQMNIDLESFQIQFDQINNQNNNNNILDEWIQNMNNKDCFIKLLPFYFDIIQKGESIENFTLSIQDSFERLQIPSKYLNMKALFQILYNNSNNELKMILIKQYSQYYPIPFLYQNLKLDKFDSELDLFKLNHLIFYLFPKCYPIISFSLSNKQKKYGKTTLINEIFYQEKKFEISDNCELNNDTIDIMFDFCFNDQRKLAIADIHGQIPIKVLIKILPLFHLWIIQLKTEDELEENYINLQQILQQLNQIIPQICFIIRDSKRKINNQQQEYIKKIQNNQMEIVFIINLNDENIDYQIKIQETRKIQNFIYSLIFEENYDQFKQKERKLKKQTDFLYLIQDFNTQNEIELIKNHQILIQNLKKELNDIQKNEEKCYLSSKAFPIRSLLYDISNLKAEINQLSNYNCQKTQIQNQIEKLQQKIAFSSPSKLIILFCKIFSSQQSYLLYLWFKNLIYSVNQKFTNRFNQKMKYFENQLLSLKIESYSEQIQDQMNLLKNQQIQVKNQLTFQSLNVNFFWSEIIQYQQQQNIVLDMKTDEILYYIIKKGEPIDFLDIQNMKINKPLIKSFIEKFRLKNENMLILSTLGFKNSGKSTFLNKIFGANFQSSSAGSPTGFQIQLIKIKNKQQFQNLFDQILLLDMEGLQNFNEINIEMNKKIIFFILALSNIVFIIIKDQSHSQIQHFFQLLNDLQDQYKKNFPKKQRFVWCINEENIYNNIQNSTLMFMKMVQIFQLNYLQKDNTIIKLKKNNLLMIRDALQQIILCRKWFIEKPNEKFLHFLSQKCIKILEKLTLNMSKQASFQFSLNQTINNLEYALDYIERNSDLSEFKQQFPQTSKIQNKYLLNTDYEIQEIHQPRIFLQSIINTRLNHENRFPQCLILSLEDLNIYEENSTLKDQNKIILDWLGAMNDPEKFLKLFLFLFNMIKLKVSQYNFLSLINEYQEQVNFKLLLQIMLNNSNEELKFLLLKHVSSNHPIPFISQNIQYQNISSVNELYQLNHLIFYLFKDSFPIINLSLSHTQNRIGKTELINQIFFQSKKFEVRDTLVMNQNTIDIMLNINFRDYRQLSVADCHGYIPLPILSKILPLFKVWIIQMDTVKELQENLIKFEHLSSIQSQTHSQVCFIIRNTQANLSENDYEYIQIAQRQKIQIHFIYDLTYQEQVLQEQYDQVSEFLFKQINLAGYNEQQNHLTENDFLKIIKNFYTFSDNRFFQIQSDHYLNKKFKKKLEKISNLELGFFHKKAFPIRSIQYQIKLKKDIQTNEQRKDHALQKEIETLEQSLLQQTSTKLLRLFCKIFDRQNFYITYLWLTDQLCQFKEIKTLQIIKENQINLDEISFMNIGKEIFWREIIEQKFQTDTDLTIDLSRKIYEIINKGEPMELLNFNSFKSNKLFLAQVIEHFENREKEKFLVVSQLQPQNSQQMDECEFKITQILQIRKIHRQKNLKDQLSIWNERIEEQMCQLLSDQLNQCVIVDKKQSDELMTFQNEQYPYHEYVQRNTFYFNISEFPRLNQEEDKNLFNRINNNSNIFFSEQSSIFTTGFKLSNVKIQQEIVNIIQAIDQDALVKDEDIILKLENQIQDLNENDKQIILRFLNYKYNERVFMQNLAFTFRNYFLQESKIIQIYHKETNQPIDCETDKNLALVFWNNETKEFRFHIFKYGK